MADGKTAKTLVIRNGVLIDGTGAAPQENDAIVIEGNRIKSVGKLPDEIRLGDRDTVDVIDAAGRWIMPGLIDAHCHLSYGYPYYPGEGRGSGRYRPEFGVLRSARSAQQVLRSGVTSISTPGGTYFTDVGVRDAIKLGLMDGPRIHCAGRMIITYGSIEDDDPEWVETPNHSIGVLCNSKEAMVTEVRRQSKRGVNFIKMADSRSGDIQTLQQEEIAAVVGEAHRRNLRVAIHSRGAHSTRAAAEAGVDWIVHADLANDGDLDLIAEKGIAILPTMTFLYLVSQMTSIRAEQVQLDMTRMTRHFEKLVRLVERARSLGVRILCGTDTGNNTFMPFGENHAKEAEVLVKFCGYSTLEAISAMTRDNAFAIGLEGEVGILTPGKLADVIVLDRDPVADITVLGGGRHLTHLIKDGKRIDLAEREITENRLVMTA
jgi:imidazolonepropionase-like amidohydrolase